MIQKFTTLYTNTDGKSENIEMVIDSQLGEMELKNMLQKSKIVSLSSSIFSEEIWTFANMIFTINRDDKEIKIWLQWNDIVSYCEKFMVVWINIKNVETIPNTIDEKTSSKIIADTKAKLAKKKQEEIEKKMKEKDKESHSIDGKQKDNAVAMLNQTIEDIDILRAKVNTIASGNELKKLSEHQEELKKLIRWSNIDKMKQEMEEVFILMQKLENDYIIAIRPYQENINQNSVITNIDVVNEYNTFVRANNAKKANTQQNRKWVYYSTVGELWIYLKFLWKDMTSKVSNVPNIIAGLWNIIEYTILSLAIIYGIYIIFNKLLAIETSLDLYKSLVYVGAIGFSISITKVLKSNNIVMMFLRIWASFVVYYFLMNWIVTNFSL